MKIGVIGEGETEFRCVPTMVAKFGHTIVGVQHLGGIGSTYAWDKVFTNKIYPYVRGYAVKQPENRPDRVIIVLDRETRQECCGQLGGNAQNLLAQELAREHLVLPVSVVLANRQFECWLMADVVALDTSPLMQQPISQFLANGTDEKNVLGIIRKNLKSGNTWDKPRYGRALAKRLDLRNAEVLKNSRSLRKFVKEIS